MRSISKKMNVNYLVISLLLVFAASAVKAAPPPSVARLSYIENVVSFLPGGTNKWVKAKVNRPLIQNDSLWVAKNSRTELQLRSTALRLDQSSYLKIFNLKKDIAQFQLTQGNMILSVYNIKPNQKYEINTPNLALSINKKGIYRVGVSKAGTVVSIREGDAIVYGEKSAFTIRAGFSCSFTGTSLKGYSCKALRSLDDFAKWSAQRDRLFQKASTTKYVSTAVIGYEDLDAHGTWKSVKNHGYVWIPNEVSVDWAPYRTGQWTWVRHYGWTWIDEQPWGFAPFHYGRWTHVEKRWAWVPGPVHVEPIYAPALVAFVGGRNFNIAAGRRGVAWFPLGPGDIYIPPYGVSRDYFTQINIGNTNVSNTLINQVYNDNSTNVTYQNFGVVNAVTAVPTKTFVQSQPVSEANVVISEETLLQAPKTAFPEVAPDTTSVLGSEEVTEAQPAEDIVDQSAIVKTEPAPEPVPFSKEQELLTKNPGEPLAEKEIQSLQKQEGDQQPALKMVDPAVTPEPIKEIPEGSAPAIDTEQPGLTPPAELQQPSDELQQPPAELQQPSDEVQQPSDELQQPPAELQQPSDELQQPPVELQQPSDELQQPPVELQQAPVEVQQPPVELQQAPAEVQQAPAEMQQPPAEMQQAPAEMQQAPAEMQQPPVEMQQPPVEVQQPPVEVQQPPVEVQQPPVDVQQPPTDIQQPSEEELQVTSELQAPRPKIHPSSDGKTPHNYGEKKPPVEHPERDVPLAPYGPKVPQHPKLPGEV